jgi:hypothetical protein
MTPESDALEGCPACPYIESGARPHTKKEFFRPMGREPEEEKLANLAYKERHLVLV